MADDGPAQDSRAVLVALELLRRQVADFQASFERNQSLGRPPDPSPKPIDERNPAVVMTPHGPDVDPMRVLEPRPQTSAPPERKTHQDLARMQQQAARDLAQGTKQQQTQHTGGVGRAGDRGVAGSAGATLKQVTSPLALAFGRILPPLNLLSGVLGSTTSGFGLITRTLQLLYAVLAPVLLPVLFLFAAGLLYVSDLVMKHLWPALEKLWKMVGPTLVAAFETLASVVAGLADAITWVLKQVGLAKDPEKEQADKERNAERDTEKKASDAFWDTYAAKMGIDDPRSGSVLYYREEQKKAIDQSIDHIRAAKAAEEARRKVYQEAGDARDRARGIDPDALRAERAGKMLPMFRDQLPPALAAAIGQAPPPAKTTPQQRPADAADTKRPVSFKQSMIDMLKVFQLSVGPKAQFGDLGASQVQNAILASLNTDPIEQRMLEAQQFAVRLLEQLVSNTEPDRGLFGAK